MILRIVLFFSIFTFIAGYSYCQEKEEKKDSLEMKKEMEEAETQEIVITGTRIPGKIIDIPFSVYRVDKKELAYSRNVGLKDVLADVPGLFLQSRYGGYDVRLSIRGYGNRSNSGIRGIRILQDGIPESEPDGESNVDAIDYTSLETVEVAKGNLSSLYANAPGGVVNFLTDLTFRTNYLKQNNMFGSFDLRQNGFKTGLITKNYKYFLSYNYRNYTGYRQHNNQYINLLNSVLQVYPDSRTTISIMGNYVNGFVKLPGALDQEEYENNPYNAYTVAVSSDFKRDIAKGRLAVRYNTSFGNKVLNDVEVTGYMRLNNLQYTTNLLYNFSDRNVVGGFARYNNTAKIFSRKNLFSVGVDYNYGSGNVDAYNNVGGIKGDELQSKNEEILNTAGIYLQNQYFFYKDIASAFLSARYDNIEITNNNQLFSLQNSTRKFSRYTPRFALNYKFTPSIAVYSSYGYSFDTPVASELENYPYTSNAGATTLNPDLNPQTSKSFELGIKGNVFSESDILEKSYFEVTFYDTRIEDDIVPFVINDKTYFRNAGNTTRTGVESGVKFEMFEGFELVANYSYADFHYSDYIAVNYNGVGDTISADYSGKVVPAIPKSIFNFILNYEFKITNTYTGILLWDMDYVSSMFADDANTVVIPGYFYGNVLAGVTCNFKNFNILFTAGLNNIFDEKYVGFVNVNANPELPANQRRYYEPGEPRNFYFGLNLGYKF
jgi:iron complex outermembrane recepter protein